MKFFEFFIAEFGYNIFVKGREYIVNIGFKGYTKDDNAGFYASSYRDANNQKRWLVTSQMEPTDARKSLICFDEPAMKAKFKLRVIHDSSLHVMSNMPVTSSRKL